MGPTLLCSRPNKDSKLLSLGATLQKAFDEYKGVLAEFHDLTLSSDNTSIDTQKEKCESNSCVSCIDLKQMIASKDNLLSVIASYLTRLNETKNLSILNDIFQILHTDDILTPPKDLSNENILNPNAHSNKSENDFEESMSEIEGTPTGRTSPIIMTKMMKSRMDNGEVVKKKCPGNWLTSDTKMVKLDTPTRPKNRSTKQTKLKQSRFQLMMKKPSNVVDLTCSPELSERNVDVKNVKLKLEPVDQDDTILPSPTSGPTIPNFVSKYKLNTNSHSPCKKVDLCKVKCETVTTPTKKLEANDDVTRMEHSINLLSRNRFKNSPCKSSMELKQNCDETTFIGNVENKPPDNDITQLPTSPQRTNLNSPEKSATFTQADQFDTNVSMSLLKHVEQIEKNSVVIGRNVSPSKIPLSPNVNFDNIPSQSDTEVSMSILNRDKKPDIGIRNTVKRAFEKVEPLFKQPTVRKKAEKIALPGWSCDECKNFYSDLYADEPETLARLMAECSKHRGKLNPARPNTPPQYWQTRWDVPTDTDEFNLRNGV